MRSEDLAELQVIKETVRRDTDIEAITLLTAGTLSCVTVGINVATLHTGGFAFDALHGYGNLAFALLLPLALLGVWRYLRTRESRRGVGRQSRVVGWTALVVAVLFVDVGIGYLLTLIVGPYPAVMGLVILAGIRFPSRLLIAWGIVAGGLGLFVGMFQFNNRFDLPVLDDAVGAAIAVVTLAAGIVVALRGRRG